MRRALSMLLIALFGLTPLVALAGGRENVRMPVCCRRRGAHRCEMPEDAAARIVAESSGRTATIGAPLRCPLYPGTQSATLTPVSALVASDVALAKPQTVERIHVFPAPQADSSSFSAHTVRGPPAAVLA
jgi:hypothetical protein